MAVGTTIVEERASQPLPNAKRIRLEEKSDPIPPEFTYCQKLLATSDEKPVPNLPPSLTNRGEASNDLGKFKAIFDNHGLRTTFISSPRAALSIYKDSFILDGDSIENPYDGKACLATLFGLHPQQTKLEHFYSTSIKNVYCLMLFCQRLRQACNMAMQDETIADLVSGCELQCRSLGQMPNGNYTSSQIMKHAHTISGSVPRLVAALIQRVVQVEPRNRVEQLEREYERISLWNSTLSNALMTLFLQEHNCAIKEILFKSSHQPQYERLTIYLYDPELDFHKPSHFLFLPCLHTAMEEGPMAVVHVMIFSFWCQMLRHGYFATQTTKQNFTGALKEFFLSGLTHNPNAPLQLNAHFTPSRPLSFYLYGKAGAGKSSFVRNFQPALEATIEEAADPEILARFVKQNLNKRSEVLELELELRPNNNDLSVMSIIQGRRMTMTQNKPGLVVIDFEEMPSNDHAANPNQLKVAQLISQRFSGRNGNFQNNAKPAPRNSGRRGIANDASLVTLFTSNYELDDASRDALKRLKMFETLDTMEMTAVSGSDRVQFADSYLRQCLKDRFAELNPQCQITLEIPIGDGDTRPLVRFLRMAAFYIGALVTGSVRFGSTIEATVQQNGSECTISTVDESIELRLSAFGLLFPVTPRVYDPKVHEAMRLLHSRFIANPELSIVLDFWFAHTLSPAVIVSNDVNKIKSIMKAVSALKDVFCIENVNGNDYKMMKSLYDPNDTPNLRDDILKLGRGANVAIDLECPTNDAQLCVREIIEDSPSMTAFSTAKSALYKEGLLFAIHVTGDITPEIRSRASIIL